MTDGATLRVATWNLWWRHGDWEARQPAILECLRDLDADIVALQEASSREPDQLEWLHAELGYHVVASPQGVDDRYGVVNGLLSRWPIISSRWEYLDVGDMPPHRTVLQAIIESPSGALPVVCTHLSHGFDKSELRTRQLRQIAALVAEMRLEPDVLPPLLLGDLNAVPEADEIRMLTGRGAAAVDGLVFSDVWEHAGSGPGATYAAANPHVTDSAWPERRLDYIMVGWPRPRPWGNPVDVRLFGTEPSGGVVASDHYGVVAELRS